MIAPMFAMVVLTFVTLLMMFKARVQAMRSGQLKMSYFKTYNEGEPPAKAVQAARHFSNLFETPVLFYAACLATMIIHADGPLLRVLAWVYVAIRVVHAFIHLGANPIMARMYAFMASVVVLLTMWTVLFVTSLGV